MILKKFCSVSFIIIVFFFYKFTDKFYLMVLLSQKYAIAKYGHSHSHLLLSYMGARIIVSINVSKEKEESVKNIFLIKWQAKRMRLITTTSTWRVPVCFTWIYRIYFTRPWLFCDDKTKQFMRDMRWHNSHATTSMTTLPQMV